MRALGKQDGRISRALYLIRNHEAVLVKGTRIYKDYSFDNYMHGMDGKHDERLMQQRLHEPFSVLGVGK